MIEHTLNKGAAAALFEENAIFFFNGDAVPEYRIYELFGTAAAEFYYRNKHCTDLFVGGRDYNATGACDNCRPLTTYFTKSGFMQFVTEHNYQMTIAASAQSDGGRIAADYMARWNERISESEAAEEQARIQRKAKRTEAAAKRKAAVDRGKHTDQYNEP